MSTIPASAIVQVLPNVLNAGGSALDLNGIVLTENTRVPIGAVQSFPTAAAVSSYFGAASNEAAIAAVYFQAFKNASAVPGAILFAQYPNVAVAAYLRSGIVTGIPLSTIQALSGSLTVAMDGYVHTAANLSLSGATSFSAAAALIQAALTASEPTEAAFTGSLAGNILTVSAVSSGTLSIGQTISGAGVADGTVITALGTGTGLTGTYTVSTSQTVASESLTAVATAPTVSFDAIAGAFVITSGITGAPSTAAFATGTLAAQLALTQATGAVLSQGAAAATPGAFMTGITQVTQNWATFMTAFDPDAGAGNSVKLAFAAWTSAQNKRYAYVCWDTDITPTESTQATQSLGYLLAQNQYDGTCLIYESGTYYTAAFVCGVAAAIDFSAVNGRITFAFRAQAGLTASVTNETVAANLEANGYNFVGAYATANEGFVFFYPGSVSGEFQWMDSYVNQIWLNNALQLALMNLLTEINSIPYNAQGYALIEAACADPIAAALNAGVIETGIPLSAQQAAEINNAAGVKIDRTITTQGYYLQVQPASPQVRQARTSPPIFFWYTDGQSVQKITLNSIDVQ